MEKYQILIKSFGINNCDILVSMVILAAKEVIYTKRKNGVSLNLLQVKKCLLSQMKWEEYWSILANEMDLFFRKWKRMANDF